MSRPSISVVVLSYNRPEHLANSLRSVFAQDVDADLDVIVVDNLSPKSAEVAQVVADFPRVRFLPQNENLGFSGGMNVGMAATRGDYLHLHEDDIVLDAGFYANLLPVVQCNPNTLFSGVLEQRPGGGLFYCG